MYILDMPVLSRRILFFGLFCHLVCGILLFAFISFILTLTSTSEASGLGFWPICSPSLSFGHLCHWDLSDIICRKRFRNPIVARKRFVDRVKRRLMLESKDGFPE